MCAIGGGHCDGLDGWVAMLSREASIATLLLGMSLPMWYALSV
jgi:hypothetical protein